MIGKAKSIAHTAAAIDYALDKEKAYELSRHGIVGERGGDIQQEFSLFQRLNHNCEKHTFSVVLSPSVEDGKQLTNEQLRDITQGYLKSMGLQDHQHAAYVHQDKSHKHIHLFVNRVDSEGKAYPDSFIGKKTQRVADELARDRGLIRAKEVEQLRANSLQQTREQLKRIHLSVMKSRPRDFAQYTELMASKGVIVAPSVSKSGKMQGFRVGLNKDTMLKASQVWKGMTLVKIQPLFAVATKAFSRNRDRGIGR